MNGLVILCCLFLTQCGSPALQDDSQEAGFAQGTAGAQNEEAEVWIFERRNEPRENAFSLLIPRGWQIEGGIFRVDPNAQGGSGQSIEAKLDMAVKDPSGAAMIRFLPETYFMDSRWMPAASLFPPGSNYNGMMVMYLPEVSEFIRQVAFPYAHPNVRNPRQGEFRQLPDIERKLREEDAPILPGVQFGYKAGYSTFFYEDGGGEVEEVLVAAVMDFGQLGAGLWKNRHTFLMRAPKDQFEKFKPVFGVMLTTIQVNQQWLHGEIMGQMQRGEIAWRTQQELQQIEREIVEARQKTNAQIQHDQYLSLMGREEYVNPFTGGTEQGTNEWNYRWQNERGEIIYTDNTNYDPNRDPSLQVQGFKRSQVKPRG